MDLNWKLRCTLALMAQPCSAQCTLIVVFSEKLLPLTFSRADTLQRGRCFMAGLPTGPGHSQNWVLPLFLWELESYSFWLSRAVNDLTQGRHSVGGVSLAGWSRCWDESGARGCCIQLRLSVSLLPGEYFNQQVSYYSELACSFVDVF